MALFKVVPKSPEEIKRLREIADRLKQLGLPEETLKRLNLWIDKQEIGGRHGRTNTDRKPG